MESTKETNCQASEGPILCVNNCGFFGSATTMNMCSKCHKDMISNKQQAKLAASSIEDIVNGSSSSNEKAPIITNVKYAPLEMNATPPELESSVGQSSETKAGPNRCASCSKRVGLTGFKCKCGNLFCSTHRYSDRHDCTYDYRAAGQEAIAKANPVVKSRKLDKI